MGQAASRHKSVSPELLKPQGLYSNSKDIDLKRLKKLILDKKLAPCFRGSDFETNQANEECCICMLYYPALNKTKCCGKGLCTECFLQIKNGTGTRTNAPCPFCKETLVVVFRGPRSLEETLKAKQDEQAVYEAQVRARKAEDRQSAEMARQTALMSQSLRAQASSPTGAPSFLSAISAPIPMTPQAPAGNSQDDAARQLSRRSMGSLARRQAQFVDAKLAQYVPQDILHGSDAYASEHLDLNDLMLMQAIYASLQENGEGSGAASAAGQAESASALQASPTVTEAILEPETQAEAVSVEDPVANPPTAETESLPAPAEAAGEAVGEPAVSIACNAPSQASSSGSLDELSSSAWSTAGIARAESAAPSGYAASEGSLMSEPAEVPPLPSVPTPETASLIPALHIAPDVHTSPPDTPTEGALALAPTLDGADALEDVLPNPKASPILKAGLERFDIACTTPLADVFPEAAHKAGLVRAGGGREALVHPTGASPASTKPALANMLARLVGKSSGGPASVGSVESSPPSRSSTPIPPSDIVIGMVLMDPLPAPSGPGAFPHSSSWGRRSDASPADLSALRQALDGIGIRCCPGDLVAGADARCLPAGHEAERSPEPEAGVVMGERIAVGTPIHGETGHGNGGLMGDDERGMTGTTPGCFVASMPSSTVPEQDPGLRSECDAAGVSGRGSTVPAGDTGARGGPIGGGGSGREPTAGQSSEGGIQAEVQCPSPVLDIRGGPVVIQNPDGSEQLVLLTNEALRPPPQPPVENLPGYDEETYTAPSDPHDAALVAAIQRTDELLQEVYASSASPEPAATSADSRDHASDMAANAGGATSGSSAEGWLERMRAADEALTRAINRADVDVAAAASR